MSMINEHADTAVYDMIDINTNKVVSPGLVLTKREAEKRNQGLSLNGTKLKYVNRFESDISPV